MKARPLALPRGEPHINTLNGLAGNLGNFHSTDVQSVSGSRPKPAELHFTPIATRLAEHFMRGGSVDEAIRLVGALEHAAMHSCAGTTRTARPDKRGSRLSPDWRPSAEDLRYALGRGMPEARVWAEAEKFLNYWTAKSGASATKRDWPATWRNWIITAMERSNGPTSYRGDRPRTDFTSRRTSAGSDAILAGMGRLAGRVDERRMSTVPGGRKTEDDADASFAFDVEQNRTR
jgi:hypothetical protein